MPPTTAVLPQENETLNAPFQEFDIGIKPHKGAPPKLTADPAAAAAVTPTRSGSDSAPSPPVPNPSDRHASVLPAAVHTATAVAGAEQAGEETVVAAGAKGVTGERGGQSGGSGTLGVERPGLVALKGASFRWTNGREEDQHAKIFRTLMEVDEKKRKVGVLGGWGIICVGLAQEKVAFVFRRQTSRGGPFD